MAQYREGSITLSFGETAVVGFGTRFLSNVKTGDMLLVDASGPAAFVASVLSDTELLLEQAWPGGNAAASAYAIHRDFDPTTGAPLLAPGDTGLPLVFNRAVRLLSAPTAVAVAGSQAVAVAQAARDAAQTAANTAAADAVAVAAARLAVTEDKVIVAADKATVATDKAATLTARDAAMAGAATTTTDRTAVAADKAATQTALAAAQALVGSAGTGTATGLAYAPAVKSLLTAADVTATYIWDTRLDDDGGAWTRRQDNSWYWETLGTGTRGATRRFPAVALLVLRVSNLFIYDLHDLDVDGKPRMWMVFLRSGSNALTGDGGNSMTAVAARNGRVYVCSSGGFITINFVADTAERNRNTALTVARFVGGLAQRNDGIGSTAISGSVLPSNSCLSADITVHPGAPLDRAGLPIPTVAVGSAAGGSVIYPWGALVNLTGISVATVRWVDGGLVLGQDASSSDGRGLYHFGPIPYASATVAAWRRKVYAPSVVTPSFPAMLTGQYGHTPVTERIPGGWVAGKNTGLSLLVHDPLQPDSGMSASITTAFNTGWQPGNTCAAWLCDATAGSVSGSAELVTNGDFAGGVTGWGAVFGAGLSASGGQLTAVRADSEWFGVEQTISGLVVGQTYLLSAQLSGGTYTAVRRVRVALGSGGNSGEMLVLDTAAGYSGPVLIRFQAMATSVSLGFHGGTGGVAGETLIISAVSIRSALPDRSYRARGLVPVGTLTLTALPCGLAALSGFGAAAYVEQPYNPDMDFGAADFCTSWWMRCNDTTVGQRVWQRWTATGTGALIQASLQAGGFVRFTITDGSASASVDSTTAVFTLNRWVHVAAVRRGGVLELWVDGVREGIATASAVGSVSNTTAVSRIGCQVSGASPYMGSVAMFKMAAYAPVPSQLRRMYEDERQLIVIGRPATLAGTSSTVKSLCYDPATGTLSVGTTDGVSVLSGLGRASYLDGTSAATAIANDSIVSVSASGAHTLVATTANVGLISDGVIARDRMMPAAPPRAAPRDGSAVITACGVTTDATPTDLSPHLYVGEREAVTLDVTVQARTYGASSSQGGTYRRLARYVRDPGGAVTLSGSVQTIGTDQESTTGMDATLSIDISAQTVSVRVTGVAATRMVWTARITVTRISEEAVYDRAQ